LHGLRTAREALGLSRRDLARAALVDRETILVAEQRGQAPDDHTQHRIREALSALGQPQHATG
jgi:transcriptional regulator with XRE-family HTH domain